MKIAYGVHGYGRGHAARALAVLPELVRRHEVRVLAGDDAYHALEADYDVVRIPVLRYSLDKKGKRSALRTIGRSIPAVLDLKLRGPITEMVCDVLRELAPDVVISDTEAWTHRAAATVGLPRIGFDHFAVLAECDWPMSWWDRRLCGFEVRAYRGLMGRPQRCVIASFYAPPVRRKGVRVVGPVLRREVLDAQTTRGEFLLVYLSNGDHHFTPKVEAALAGAGLPVVVYGTSRCGGEGGLQFKPISNETFVADLAACRAVFSTAGNQLISEAVHLQKPMLVMPEDSLEQRLNAETIERLQFGLHVRRQGLTGAIVRRFLDGEAKWRGHLRRPRRDGAREAVDAIEEFARELAGAGQ